MLLILACHVLLILAANPSTGNPVAEIENQSSQTTFARDANCSLPSRLAKKERKEEEVMKGLDM